MRPPVDIPLYEYENANGRHESSTLSSDAGRSSAVFGTILAVCPPSPEGASLLPAAEAFARLAGARLAVATTEPPAARHGPHASRPRGRARWTNVRANRRLQLPENPAGRLIAYLARQEHADVVAIATSHKIGRGLTLQMVRPVLDAGSAVLIVPPLPRSPVQLARIGIGYDGGKPSEAALATARDLANASPGQTERFEIAHVDDSASAWGDADGDVLESRRGAVIQWWLEQLGQQVSVPVHATRSVGEPAAELAQLSRDLDLLVIGTRRRAPLRRALTGSVSKRLIAATRCPLLIVPSGVSVRPPSRDRFRPVTPSSSCVTEALPTR